MRTNGKITHWNAEKGYGFITPSSGAKQVFVHIRAFHNQAQQPAVGDMVTFELSTDRQGRPCAQQVTRAGEVLRREPRRESAYQRKARHSRQSSSLAKTIGFLVVLGVLGVFVYTRIHEYLLRAEVTTLPVLSPYQETPSSFHCDGRTYCSEMSSCEEATFFIRNCPGTKMDGDGDGVPCERQWCG